MNHREIAEKFIACFCAGDIDGLATLLADDLRFTGPFFRFDSSNAYLDSLRNDPPEPGSYRLLSVTEDSDAVSVFYEYDKNGRPMTIAQLFGFRNGRISDILLVFDGSKLP